MGAWGMGPFDNDSALDFLGGLSDRGGDVTEGLREGMAAVVDARGYLDSDDVNGAVAAACLVAARIEPGVLDDPNGREYLGTLAFTVDAGMRELAGRVFARAFEPGDNEWYALWDDGGAIPKVADALAPYREVL
ncbi:DUF4259 domain-containing protein [Actinomadura kijaniata]|uniref:DUF4259 domain-containing protein n=1 Tax=Actinomadura kijaniata TaxID=46161 RepID=UPI003F1D7D40